MSRHNYKKSRLKYVFLAFTCATAFALSGIASACGNNSSSNDDDEKTTKEEDTQLIKNGNFEFFTIPDKVDGGNEPEYLIKSVQNWTHGGTNSYTMSGIISTSETYWGDGENTGKLTDPLLAGILDDNNALDSSASYYLDRYVDYNGMKSSDLLYKDQYKALLKDDDKTSTDDKDEEELEPESVRKALIENPGTHYNVKKAADGKYYTNGGDSEKGQRVYLNDDGEYFLAYDAEEDKYSEPISNILMLHNYATSHNGIAQYYSSVSVDLPANTAAEISVWVKTSYLKYHQGEEVDQDRGANISVTQTVGSTTLDKFTISCINTEKLLGLGNYSTDEKVKEDEYNGWLQYTIYVNACDFASTSVKIELGLGETGAPTEGYAFFDDVSVTKYKQIEDSESYVKAEKDGELDKTTCNISTDASEKIYKADVYDKNEGGEHNEQFANNFYYFIDLASEHSASGANDGKYSSINFKDSKYNLNMGLTIDDDNYVSSTNLDFNTGDLTDNNNYSDCRLPFTSSLKDKGGLVTKGDLLSLVTTAKDPFTADNTSNYQKLNSVLNSAANLPKNSENNYNNMLVMLSAHGAAYTTTFDLTVPRVGGNDFGYQIVSFWVKTSDMDGNTAATVSITQKGNDDNTASFTIDTTGIETDIDDEQKNIYDGWVQCFFFVHNELEKDDEVSDTYTVKFSFGNTTIKGSEVYSYKAGWVALANMQYLNVDEDVFDLTGNGSYTASLTISEEAKKNTQAFDEAYGNQSSKIKNEMVIPSSYKGVNGASSAVVNNDRAPGSYDSFNNNVDHNGNKFTGLINREYFEEGNYGNYGDENSLFELLYNSFKPSSTDAIVAWNDIFGKTSYQPLIITNTTKTRYLAEKGATEDTYKNYFIKDSSGNFIPVPDDAEYDEDETYYRGARNYGYIGEDKSVSASSYATISVRVKASANAVAYIYLVDTSASKNVLSFSAPSYSFYYDEEGNVLYGEPKKDATLSEQRENIAYYLRDDGLYENADRDGKLYANLYNYGKLYYENIDYYDADGNKYTIDELVDGVTYYKDEAHQNEANHYLVTSSGIKVYQCINGKYHYIVEGKAQSEVVEGFNKDYARYSFANLSDKDNEAYKYMVEVVGKDHLDDKGVPQWVTVNFVIHAGNDAKPYRLELWSGQRDQTGLGDVAITDSDDAGSVIFDYSYTSISNDDVRNSYEQQIINAYIKAFKDKDLLDDYKIPTVGKNIAYFEELAAKVKKERNIDINIDTDYKAYYYTYSLYDSANFQPFNKEVASDGATGYDYSVADQSESLTYLSVTNANSYNVFVDYSSIDKSVTLNNPSDNNNGNDNDDDDNGNDGSVWLLISSIVLVIALVFAIIAIFLKDVIKKSRRNRVTSKNNYDQRKANRYKRRLHLKQDATVEVDADEYGKETPAADDAVVPEEVEEVVEEAPIEEAPAEEAVEEVPETTEEVVEETPVEEAPAEQSSDDDSKKE